MTDPGRPKLTIAIPIHQAERWIPGIIENVAKAPEWSRVVISDASGLDDSAARLEGLFGGNPIVQIVKRRDHLDWVAHCNLLLEEAETDYFCWLPQDDILMSDRYFERLAGALDEDFRVAVAVPEVHVVY
ncbi:MAG: glycosyltransferase family A protein, partial [Solirubrobacterales bacterium]